MSTTAIVVIVVVVLAVVIWLLSKGPKDGADEWTKGGPNID
jgi:hypothetical protein